MAFAAKTRDPVEVNLLAGTFGRNLVAAVAIDDTAPRANSPAIVSASQGALAYKTGGASTGLSPKTI
jgi:hypothetical protein